MHRFRLDRRELLSWPWLPVLLLAAGLLLAGVPEDFKGEDFEGPTLLPLGPHHALQVTNFLAIAALAVGSVALLWGAWRHAEAVLHSTQRHPVTAGLLSMQLAVGLLLILMSGVSTTLLYWASGTFLAVTALLGLSALLKQGVP